MSKKLKRTIKIAISTLVIILVIALTVIYFALNSIVAQGIRTFGTQATGTKVEVQSVNISPFGGSLEIKGLSVANPKDYESGNALVLNRFFVNMNLKSIFSDKIIINEVLIEGMAINLEPSVTSGSNLQEINNNISAYTSAEKTQQKEPSQKPGKKVVIKHLLIQNGTITISSSLLKNNIKVPMAKIQMRDIGENDKESAGDVLQTVFNQMLSGISSAASGAQGINLDSLNVEGVSKASESVGKEIGNGLKSLGASFGL